MSNPYELIPMYSNHELRNFLSSLESKYIIEDAQEKYHNLVNFSQNVQVPYHQWFKYREGFAAELIQELIRMSGASKDEVIIDPFCGSGTTNVVAALSGFSTLGLDVNPMSAFITAAKTQNYDENSIVSAINEAKKLTSNGNVYTASKYEEIRKYFNDSNFASLLVIKSYIDAMTDSPTKVILFVAFISIIEDCSNRKRDGNGLKTVRSKVTDVFKCFSDKVELIVEDIRNIQPPRNITGVGSYSSAFELYNVFQQHFPDSKAGAIIFSPPYPNSFDYFESYKLELVFADFSSGISGLNVLRKKAVRSFVGAEKQSSYEKYVDLLANEIEQAIPEKEKEKGKRDDRTRKVPDMLRGYFADMHEVIKQCSKSLLPGKMTYIVVDQSAYLGKIVPTDLLLAHFGEEEGFTVDRIIECRKARTSTQQLKKYPYLKSALRESIVCLKKTDDIFAANDKC